MKQFLQKSVFPARQNSIDEELAKMIALDFQPFSVVNDKGFRKFIHAIPSRKTLSPKKSFQAYMTENMHYCKRGLKKSHSALSNNWQLDILNPTSFLSVTSHFVENYKMISCLLDCFEFSDRHLAEELLKVAKEWDLENKVGCCVTDNAANIT